MEKHSNSRNGKQQDTPSAQIAPINANCSQTAEKHTYEIDHEWENYSISHWNMMGKKHISCEKGNEITNKSYSISRAFTTHYERSINNNFSSEMENVRFCAKIEFNLVQYEVNLFIDRKMKSDCYLTPLLQWDGVRCTLLRFCLLFFLSLALALRTICYRQRVT